MVKLASVPFAKPSVTQISSGNSKIHVSFRTLTVLIVLVSFEDLLGTPEGINGYNDLSFSFTNTHGANPVPEASTTLAMALTVGVAGVSAIRRKLKR